MTNLTEQDLPTFWRDADSTAADGQKWTLRYERIRLVGTLIAALGAILTVRFLGVDLGALLIFGGFGIALASELAAWVHQPERRWYDGRALAESTKTLAWRFAVAADPFPLSLPLQTAEEMLRERVTKIASEVPDSVEVRSGPMVTPGMQSLRESSFVTRKNSYLAGRTEEQRNWYAEKAASNRIKAIRWRITLVIAEVAGFSFAAMRVAAGWPFDLAGFVAAGVAAGAAWMAVKQYSPLATAYSMTAMELTIQAQKLQTISEDEWPQVAADAEEAISREHTLWLASRTGRVPRV